MESSRTPRIAVVIPCYRVASQALTVIDRIGDEVGWIIVVDDACPEGTGDLIERDCRDPRVTVIRHEVNRGVGGAVLSGYNYARTLPAEVIVKIDGDGQMDPLLIPKLCEPLLQGNADYVKGNRFYHIRHSRGMPVLRLIGNGMLSFLTKLSSGYWQLFDPTNGFTAIHRSLLSEISDAGVATDYFFESDILYHLNQLRAVVAEFPMESKYADEPSSLRPLRAIGPFLRGNLRNFTRRVFYSYFVRGFSAASIELLIGIALVIFGMVFGIRHWWMSVADGLPATAGTVMIAALPLIIGTQFLLSWLAFDVAAEPRFPVHALLSSRQVVSTNRYTAR